MALTLEAEQRLTRVNLVNFYENNDSNWNEMAQRCYDFCRESFPESSTIRRDDVAKAFIPILEIEENLIKYLGSNKLNQKYWIRDFCDLIIDRCWEQINR